MTQYRRNRVYQGPGGARSIYVEDVVPDRITLRKNLSPSFSRRRNPETPFIEVGIVPPTKVVGKAVRRLMGAKVARQTLKGPEFARRVFGAMVAAVERSWKPGALHVVQHSSGWDSRMISLAIRELASRNGGGWLGDVLFLELSGEGPAFRDVMRAQGWKDAVVRVWNEGSRPREHHEIAFEFGDAWRRLNGWCGYPMNVNWHPFKELRERGELPPPGQLQIFSGYGANEVAAAFNGLWGPSGFRSYVERMYWHPLSSFPLWGGADIWSFPFLDLDYIKAYAAAAGGRGPDYRKVIVKHVAPNVAAVRPINKHLKQKQGYRTASKAILARCVADYEASWLGREVFPVGGKRVAPRPDINYYDWWGYWSLASFCEELRRRGVEIAA